MYELKQVLSKEIVSCVCENLAIASYMFMSQRYDGAIEKLLEDDIKDELAILHSMILSMRIGETITQDWAKELGGALAHALGRYFEIENEQYAAQRIEVQAAVAANHEQVKHGNEHHAL